MRRLLIFEIVIALIIAFSCGGERSMQIEGIWLLKDKSWQDSQTGIAEIDTVRKEAYTEILALYNDRFVHGNVSLYQDLQTDTIVIAYEAGEMLFTGDDCFKVKEIVDGERIITNKRTVSFTGSDALLYDGKVFDLVENIGYKNKIELCQALRKFCR